jgi:acid phosphatase class B
LTGKAGSLFDQTEIRWFTILGVKKRDGQVRTWLDLAFDIDDTVGGLGFESDEQTARFVLDNSSEELLEERNGAVRLLTGLDLAFDIDDTVGGCFGLIEQ